MYLTEAEREDKEITESWKGDAEGILVFVSARLFISSVPPSKARVKDWSLLQHRRVLHYCKLPEPISCFQRYDQRASYSNIPTTGQRLQSDTTHERGSADHTAIPTHVFCH